MSTIASPRDPATPFPRRTHSSQNITTPTSSTRPSMDNGTRSTQGSPVPNSSGPVPAKRTTNRAALREYYNLKHSTVASSSPSGPTPTLEITDPLGSTLLPSSSSSPPSPSSSSTPAPPPSSSSHSEVPLSDLDSPHFDAAAYVRAALAANGMADLLRLYARAAGEARALDAERKALVYDNYAKLIAATETIRRMRATMDPLAPVASTLDPAVGRVYEMARACGEEEAARRGGEEGGAERKRKRAREVAREVLAAPGRVRALVAEGRVEEARRAWDLPRRLLVSWKEKGVGGPDVDVCIQEGDAALREAGDESPRSSSGNSGSSGAE